MNRGRAASAGAPSAEELAARVAELKRLAVENDDLRASVDYFHGQLAMVEAFMKLGQVGRDAPIQRLVERATARAVPSFELRSFMAVHVPDHRLWHGFAQGPGRGSVVFFYFDDISLGVAHVVASTGTHNHYVRFSGASSSEPMP